MRNSCGRFLLVQSRRQDRFNSGIHVRIVGRAARLEHAVEADGIAELCRTYCNDAKAHAAEDLEREKTAMLPATQAQSLSCEQHVLADRCGFAEGVVAGLSFQERQRHRPFAIEKSALQPCFSTCAAKALAIVNDVPSTVWRCVAAQRRVDKLCDQGDQRTAHVAYRHEQG